MDSFPGLKEQIEKCPNWDFSILKHMTRKNLLVLLTITKGLLVKKPRRHSVCSPSLLVQCPLLQIWQLPELGLRLDCLCLVIFTHCQNLLTTPGKKKKESKTGDFQQFITQLSLSRFLWDKEQRFLCRQHFIPA